MSSRPPHSKAARLVVLRTGAASGRAYGADGHAPGKVLLVGAGPGDPDLLTLRALKEIQAADVIVHDGLVSQAILALAPAQIRRIDVAKHRSRHSYPQEEINRMLVAFAREGLTVVRLKGGDPFIFGRGGEELEACRAAGIVCHVVPGVTAAMAAGAGAGAPLTHRGAAQAVTFVTGHAKAGEAPDLDWPALARANQTVVIYMGLATAADIAARLVAAGRAPSTPAVIVENASLEDERRVVTTLGALGDAAEQLSSPAILIIGEAMALAQAASSPSPMWGAAHSEGVRVGQGAATPISPTAPFSTLAAAQPPPPPPGGGRKGKPMKALTANRLADGEVVFWTGEAWSERFADAILYEDNELAEGAEAHAKAQVTLLVDPYLIEIAPVDGGVAPVSYRERLRALGPTNKPDHGKQAQGGDNIAILAKAHGAARSKGRVDLIRRK